VIGAIISKPPLALRAKTDPIATSEEAVSRQMRAWLSLDGRCPSGHRLVPRCQQCRDAGLGERSCFFSAHDPQRRTSWRGERIMCGNVLVDLRNAYSQMRADEAGFFSISGLAVCSERSVASRFPCCGRRRMGRSVEIAHTKEAFVEAIERLLDRAPRNRRRAPPRGVLVRRFWEEELMFCC
jgi:hypothetical protein